MCLKYLKCGQVWHRFAYTTGKLYRDAANHSLRGYAGDGLPHPDSPLQPVRAFPWENDAFHTIMQWLYSRIEDTRGPPPGG